MRDKNINVLATPVVKEIKDYIIPMLGNVRSEPYGKLLVTDGTHEQVCEIRDRNDGGQFITFQRKRYQVIRSGDLYHPAFRIGEMIPRAL